jgi:2-methylisocitrate lyase-like PEP mutase family enzyme
MKVYTVLIEDRSGNQIGHIETRDVQAAEAEIARVRAQDPNAMITRTEREDGS